MHTIKSKTNILPTSSHPNQPRPPQHPSTGDLVSTSQPKRLKKSTEERRSCRWDRTLQISSQDVPQIKIQSCSCDRLSSLSWKSFPRSLGCKEETHVSTLKVLCEHKMRSSACRVEVHRSWFVLSHWDHISPVHFSHPLKSLEASRIQDCARPSWKWWQTYNARQTRNIPESDGPILAASYTTM